MNKNKQHRRDKPWDNDSIDHWAIESVDKEKNPLPPPVEESSFATLFPKYREKYLREIWPLLTKELKHYGVTCELDLIQGSMSVKTTRRTWDPSIILKARDVIKLLSRSIPVQQAVKVLQDGMYADIIKIKNMVRNKERFVKRRERLIGPNGATLKAIELVTNCYVLVQGNTVSVMGGIHGLKAVRKIVTECMKNIHPIYNIKTLMIKQQLAADPQLKGENWDRFLPSFKKKNVQRKKPKVINKKKEEGDQDFTPFPPPQQPRKIDCAMMSGEFFLSKEQKEEEIKEKKHEENKKKKMEKREERNKQYIAPEEQEKGEGEQEKKEKKQKKEKKKEGKGEAEQDSRANGEEVGEKKKEKEKKKRKAEEKGEGSLDFQSLKAKFSASAPEEYKEKKEYKPEDYVEGMNKGKEEQEKKKKQKTK